jgi:hypothetical protein
VVGLADVNSERRSWWRGERRISRAPAWSATFSDKEAHVADDTKKLEMRITELENSIKQLVEARQAVDVSASELQAYLKVKGALEPDFCGPNDCMVLCLRCVRCVRCIRCITFCINECTCGPCISGGGVGGGGFGSMGG